MGNYGAQSNGTKETVKRPLSSMSAEPPGKNHPILFVCDGSLAVFLFWVKRHCLIKNLILLEVIMGKTIFKKKLGFLAALAFASLILTSCGGSNGGGTSSGSGNVSLFATDAPMDDFKQVKATVNNIQLVHKGTGASCDVLTTPATFDITDLAGVMQLLNSASCPAENYNRIRIEFAKNLTITDAADTTYTCSFTSFKDEHSNPNMLQCTGNDCSVEITGAVNVLANKNNKVALDFNLKEFEVNNPGLSECSVTMKVSPLSAGEMEDKKGQDSSKEAVTGFISDLNTASDTFKLTKGDHAFTVNYSGINQSGIDQLLQFADDNDLRVRAFCSNSVSDTNSCSATSLFVKAEGTVSNLDTTAHTFTLTFKAGQSITVDYTDGKVEGCITNKVEVKLLGISGDGKYLALKVEHEEDDLETDDED